MWKTSEAANPVFQWIFVLNSVKQKLLHVSIFNLRKKKWLLCCSYNSHKSSISTRNDFPRSEPDLHSSNYENFKLQGDFNSEMTDMNSKDFSNLYLKNSINKLTCLKNLENPKTIDLILTNRLRSFCNSDTLETGL